MKVHNLGRLALTLSLILAAGCDNTTEYIWQEGNAYNREAICDKLSEQLIKYKINEMPLKPNESDNSEKALLMKAYRANGCEK